MCIKTRPTCGPSFPLRKPSCALPTSLLTIDRGADDDGSGVTSSVTAVAGLIAANYTPVTPVEFHYYSAEEGGLLGSQAIAQQYERDSRKVKAMLQVDMTAYVKPGTKEVIGVIEDFVDSDLTDWIVTLVEKYRQSSFLARWRMVDSYSGHTTCQDQVRLRVQ